MTPVYSIIVPIYKAETYLPACLDSILCQTYRDFELVLVDDGSPDGCPAICDEYARRDDRITVLHQSNQGVTAARRAALDRTRGEYICFVDADDYVGPDWLEGVETCAASCGRPDMLLTGFTSVTAGREDVNPAGPEVGFYDRDRLERELFPYMLYDRRRHFYRRLLGNGFLPTKICRRQLLLDHFLADSRIRIYEDVCMSYECVYAAQTLYSCPVTCYYYRLLDQSASHQDRPDYLRQIRLCADYMTQRLGAAPVMAPQVNAYCVMRVMSGAIRLLTCGLSLPAALLRFRREMRATRIASVLHLRGLPLHIQVFTALLKCRLYMLAALSVKARLLMEKK